MSFFLSCSFSSKNFQNTKFSKKSKQRDIVLPKFIPTNTKSILFINYKYIPTKIKKVLSKIELLKFPNNNYSADKLVLFWESPKKIKKNAAIFWFSKVNFKLKYPNQQNFRKKIIYLLKNGYAITQIKPNMFYINKEYKVKMATDIISKQAPPSHPITLFKLITTSFKQDTAVYYVISSLNLIFNNKLYPDKAGMFVRFPYGWIVVKIILYFDTPRKADDFVNYIQKAIFRFYANPILKELPWKEIITPLTVHSEGKNVYLQWNTKLPRFYSVLNKLNLFLEKRKNVK